MFLNMLYNLKQNNMTRLIIISLLFVSNSLFAQSLIDIYKKGTVKLVPDKEFAQGNNWKKIFPNYYDTNKPMGDKRSIVMFPDGSVVVNYERKDYYAKFDSKGKFIEDFGIINSSGKQLMDNNQPIKGVMGNVFFTGTDNMGKMICCDFTGKHIKTLKLNYGTRDMIPLSNNKIAVVGRAMLEAKFCDFVAIVDYKTNEEKIIWEHFIDENNGVQIKVYSSEEFDKMMNERRRMFSYYYFFNKKERMSFNTMPFSEGSSNSSSPMITFVKKHLIIAIPATGEILTYTIDGKFISKEKIGWSSNEISVDEQKEIQKNAIEKFEETQVPFRTASKEENDKAKEIIIKQMKEDLNNITTPIKIPAFSTIIKDSDENLLFFEIPKENGANKFNVWVYDNGGKFISQSRFECDEYNLSITPSAMVFHNGYIYSLQTLKETTDNPLRLVRFKLTNKE